MKVLKKTKGSGMKTFIIATIFSVMLLTNVEAADKVNADDQSTVEYWILNTEQ